MTSRSAENAPFRVAVIADAHYHDPGVTLGGAGLWTGGKRLMLRSWADTASASRAVNESAAALEAALSAIVAEGLRHVVLLGDYTDDGQTGTTQRLAARLRRARDRHGLRFYAIPGNHDVWGTHGKHVAARYLTRPGKTVLVTSDPVLAAATGPDSVVTRAMYCEGIPNGLLPMAEFGLFRHADDLHWESPFGASDCLAKRSHDATSADGSVTHPMVDASYLVEPAPGLWLLMIDANVFEPQNGIADPARKRAFHDPATAGWDAVLRVKPHLLPWIADVAARARALGKTLLAFSHYPALDPFDDAPGVAMRIFGRDRSARLAPGRAPGDALLAAGITFHASGHLHVAAITRRAAQGRVADPDSPGEGIRCLTNLAVPSITAFPPGFAVLSALDTSVTARMIPLGIMPLDPEVVGIYRAEDADAVPDPAYGGFLLRQFRARVARHHLPQGWPPEIAALMARWTAADLACSVLGLREDCRCDPDPAGAADVGIALHEAEAMRTKGLDPAALAALPLSEVVADWYVLRHAGGLAVDFLPPERLVICRALAALVKPRADALTGGVDDGATDDTGRFWPAFLGVLSASLARMDRNRHDLAPAPPHATTARDP